MKKTISISLIFIIFLTAFSPLRLNAQIRSNQTAKNEAAQTSAATPDLRRVINGQLNESVTTLDANQMEKESFNSAKRAKLSKGQRTGIYIGIAAAIVVAVIVIIVARGGEDDPNLNCSVTCTAVGCPPPPPCP